ncbi:MAG: hypothetical protein H7Y38_12920 [Armatimonadetes bacterium]|nr:hypothetical protein [Armatimonadota bacterium]
MQRNRITVVMIAASMILATGTVANASDEYGGGWAVPSLETSLSIGSDIINSEMMMRNVRRKQGISSEPRTTKRSPRKTVAKSKAATRKVAVATAKQIQAFDDIVAPYGLQANNPADGLTAYLVMAWVVANKTDLPTPEAVRGVQNQMTQGLAKTKTQLSPAQTKQLRDLMVLQFLRLNARWREVKNNGAAYLALSDAVNSDLGKYALRSHVLGASGLMTR